MINEKRYYTVEEVMKKFNDSVMEKQNKILIKALKLTLLYSNGGTYEYTIARAMGYNREYDGSYTYGL